jgi:hypothetical protein
VAASILSREREDGRRRRMVDGGGGRGEQNAALCGVWLIVTSSKTHQGPCYVEL